MYPRTTLISWMTRPSKPANVAVAGSAIVDVAVQQLAVAPVLHWLGLQDYKPPQKTASIERTHPAAGGPGAAGGAGAPGGACVKARVDVVRTTMMDFKYMLRDCDSSTMGRTG